MQLQLRIGLAALVTIAGLLHVAVEAQSYPPRLHIPGELPGSPIPLRQQFRNEKLVRVRRPIALRSQNNIIPAITPRIIEEPKPVTESSEEQDNDHNVFLPAHLQDQQLAHAQQAQFQQTAAAFFNSEPNGIGQDGSSQQHSHEENIPQAPPQRFAERPAPSQRPAFNDFGIGSNIGGGQRFGLDRPQQSAAAPPPPPPPTQRINVIRTRPNQREQRPQFEAQSAPAPPPVRARPKPIQSRPIIDQNQLQDERETQPRRQRPVSQTLRKWRDENEDGSITWGYENDDGSFKEELIGTDCVTKGTYGYIDPDGNKREYHYETGNKCDPNNREPEEDLQENGFINYEENKAVLPNGIEIDMSQLGKKKSKRPSAVYRN